MKKFVLSLIVLGSFLSSCTAPCDVDVKVDLRSNVDIDVFFINNLGPASYTKAESINALVTCHSIKLKFNNNHKYDITVNGDSYSCKYSTTITIPQSVSSVHISVIDWDVAKVEAEKFFNELKKQNDEFERKYR